MKQWFTSLNGAIALSVLTLLTELWRGFLDAMYVFPEIFSDEGTMNFSAVVFTLLFAAWAWTLMLAERGSRRGLFGAFAINALVLIAVPFSWLLVYCPAACRAEAGIFNLANTFNLVFGVLAAVALGFQIWQGRTREATKPAQAVS